MQKITKKQVEEISLNLLKDFGKKKGVVISPPIPVFEIVEFLGYDIDFRRDGIYEDSNILGGLSIDKKTVEINENIGDQEGRMYFTAAHEIGHLLIHANDYYENNNCKQDDGSKENLENSIELQADSFAAHLLMPTAEVRKAFFKIRKWPLKMSDYSFLGLIKKKSSKRQRAIYIANKIRLAGGFDNVSKLAFLNRLIGLGLIRGMSYQKNIAI
tara:strand:+ start:120 stop:761 length:642 start_codon:yes stop_codon:yes gene_type:complete